MPTHGSIMFHHSRAFADGLPHSLGMMPGCINSFTSFRRAEHAYAIFCHVLEPPHAHETDHNTEKQSSSSKLGGLGSDIFRAAMAFNDGATVARWKSKYSHAGPCSATLVQRWKKTAPMRLKIVYTQKRRHPMLELAGFVGGVGSSRLTMSINFCKYTMSCSYLQFMSSASVQTTFGPKYFLPTHYHVETRPFRFVFQIRVRRNHVATINTMTHRTTKTTHRFHGNEVATVLATLAQEHTICCMTF